MPDRGRLVVVGASLAGLRAVEAARDGGYDGEIILIGEEQHPPYDRPPLSKAVLRGEDVVSSYRTRESYRLDLDVDLRLGQRVSALSPSSNTVYVDDGSAIDFDVLIIATGAVPRALPDWAHLDGLFTLRNADDVARLSAELQGEAQVVIVGAGFIGSEIASSARALGKKVTILEAAPLPLVRAVGPEMGSAFAALHRRHGTDLHLDAHIVRFLGEKRVEAVELEDGRVIAADVVVIGIGAAPATGWLKGSGVVLHESDHGVLADEFLETSRPGIYAAGDVVHWPNGLAPGVSMRLENWTSAAEQGAVAARNALFPERRAPHRTVPYFWSDWYDSRIQFVGHAEGAEAVVVSGGVGEETLVALYRRDDRIVGALTVNQPSKIMKFRRMVDRHEPWTSAVAQAELLLR